MTSGRPLKEKDREKFLDELREGWSISRAAKKAGVSRSQMYKHRKEDEVFAQAWDDAIEQGTDALEDEARRRAFDGSDTMLIFTLKARRPAKYREKFHVTPLTGEGGLSALLAAIDGQTRDLPHGENDNAAKAA